jgi:hypothetical protein
VRLTYDGLREHVGAHKDATTPRRSPREIQMTAITDTGPGQLIRWHYLGYAVLALGVMTVAIVSRDHWFLNFVHVICGVLWTGIDLFMGFVIGPILRKVSLSVRREIIVRLVPRTLFLMPTLSIITGTTGWFLAKDLGLLDVPWPQFGWVAAALALVVLMTIQGLGYLLPTNLWVCIQLRQPDPDLAKIRSDDAQLLFCHRHAGDDAGPDHRHHGAFRDWLVSLVRRGLPARWTLECF